MTLPEPVSTNIGMPMVDFIRLYEQEGPFEFSNGERKAIVPGVAQHSEIIKLVYELLLIYQREQKRVIVYSETPYVLTYTSDWVTGSRVPDLMAYEASRLEAYKAQTSNWRKMPFVIVPDFCLEVISPNDVYDEVDEKVERYLADGVKLIWVLNPRTKSVRVHSASSIQSPRYKEQHSLDGGEVLPGFTIPVHAIFNI